MSARVRFTELDIHQRMTRAGTEAEAAAVAHMAAAGRTLTRFGFERVDTTDALLATFPARLAHAPDFVGPGGRMYEAQGCGASRSFIFKHAKVLDLGAWQEFINAPVRWLLWNGHDRVMYRATHEAVLWAATQPQATRVVLDPQSHHPKPATEVPISLLQQAEVLDAFAAHKAAVKRAPHEEEVEA